MFINRHLAAFARGHGGKIILTCTLQLVLILMGSLISLCTAFAVRMLQGESQILCFSALWQVFACIAALIALRYVLAKRRSIASEACSLSIKADLREALLKKLFALGPAYTGRERTGAITSTIFNKVEYLNEYYTLYLPAAVGAIVNAALIIAMLFFLNGTAAVICVIACACMLGCPMIFYFLMRERGKAEMQAHSQYYSDCLDSVQGMVALKAFNANGQQKRRIHDMGERLRRAIMGQLRITMLENVVLQFFGGLGSAFSIAVAAWQCARGGMAQENLVYALFLISACFAPMSALINAWHMGYRGVVASYSIIELKNEPVRHSLALKAVSDSPVLQDGIRLEDVSFAYNEADGDVLHRVSFTVPSRTTTALVGASGSGKSTIAQLVAGFYPVREGRVRVGETALSEDTVCAIQNQISAVWQDCHLFYGTVEENIRIGKPDATWEEIERAAREASIHDFIMALPDGYQTMLGERGMRFSGGERQRVALARAFLRNAPIVILDEATSSLDRKNELDIQQSFHRLSHGKTALVIAHRLATIQRANQIIIMDQGRILAKGTHEQLLRQSEAYRKLMGSQVIEGRTSA
ncbi:MAG: ABC transporter ATP-binding protein [Clostridia bacterium]|nr:ABC transporter ATP-binding protein [Clostridia bacterium]